MYWIYVAFHQIFFYSFIFLQRLLILNINVHELELWNFNVLCPKTIVVLSCCISIEIDRFPSIQAWTVVEEKTLLYSNYKVFNASIIVQLYFYHHPHRVLLRITVGGHVKYNNSVIVLNSLDLFWHCISCRLNLFFSWFWTPVLNIHSIYITIWQLLFLLQMVSWLFQYFCGLCFLQVRTIWNCLNNSEWTTFLW